MIIAVDFDSTCVTDNYPDVGEDIGAVPVLKDLAKKHSLILWTMRSGKSLEVAVAWFKKHDIPLYGVNNNPTQHSWTSSPKVYAQILIDDVALGCPLTGHETGIPYVDWKRVREELVARGVLG